MAKPRLLLADDSVTIQKVVNLTFADEGIDVITVGDGDTAMQMITENSPDVILADVHMPGLSGYQICEMVRENPKTKDLPVVLLVGSFEPFDESEAARVGANAFLTKPFQSIRQLVTQVSDLIEASSSYRSEPEPPNAEDLREESTSFRDVPETNDIESLYKQSFGEGESEDVDSGPPRYVDAGMDDEMIEASHADDEVAAEEFQGNVVSEDEYEPVYTDQADHYGQPTAETDGAASAPFASAAAASTESESYFDQFADTEQIPAPIQTQGDLNLDEIDLLELPPFEDGKTLEFTTTQSMIAEGGTKQVVSLSPELMETIVQKVLERLSQKD